MVKTIKFILRKCLFQFNELIERWRENGKNHKMNENVVFTPVSIRKGDDNDIKKF